MRAACADGAARQAHRQLILGCGRTRHSNLLLAQRQVHPFRRHRFDPGEVKERAQCFLGAAGTLAADAEIVAAAVDFHVEARLQQAQIFIERTAQIREPRVVGRLEQKFAQA